MRTASPKMLGYLLILIVFLASTSCSVQTAAPNEEEIILKKVIEENYVRGFYTGNFDLIEKICMPETKFMHASEEGELYISNLEELSVSFAQKDNPEISNHEILKIEVEGNSAQVKLSLEYEEKRVVIDSLNLLKLESGWTIVNAIDN